MSVRIVYVVTWSEGGKKMTSTGFETEWLAKQILNRVLNLGATDAVIISQVIRAAA
jgi:hypothetical protein